jgi:hypothetical protein
VAEEDEVDRDGESIEKFFYQLWVFPKSELTRVPRAGGGEAGLDQERSGEGDNVPIGRLIPY